MGPVFGRTPGAEQGPRTGRRALRLAGASLAAHGALGLVKVKVPGSEMEAPLVTSVIDTLE